MPDMIERAKDERDARGHLTRAGMESVLRRGESLLLGDRVITNIDDLPDEADLAAGDAGRTARAREALLAQREAVERQLTKLDAPPPPPRAPKAAEPPKAEEAPPPGQETPGPLPDPPGSAPPAEHTLEPSAEGGEDVSPAHRPFGGRKR